MNTCVCGLGLGDEGKGKVVDCLSENYDVVVRYNGGANAGHTVKHGGTTYKFHHLPSGIVNGKECILADGMVINPVSLLEEIRTNEVDLNSLKISHKAHAVMPWHIASDIRKGGKIGTTKKGIGPCYADKMHRWNAIRMGDLLEKLEDEKLQRFFAVDEAFHGMGLWEKYREAAETLSPLVCDTGDILRTYNRIGMDILFESANGIHLDIDHGTFPFVTSSGVGPAAIPQSCGLPNLHLDRIVGVLKCYSTRVGEGPFPSEIWPLQTGDGVCINDESITANKIRKQGNEYGTTTGRPRRIGWFDVDLARQAVALTGATEIALMHADTLSNMPIVKIFRDKSLVEFEGWSSVNDDNFNTFKNAISDSLNVPVSIISFGPDRSETKIYSKKELTTIPANV